MQITDKYARVPLDAIIVDRAARQRKRLFDENGNFLDSDGLLDNIAQYGVLSPIIIDADFKLIFGERRYTASTLLGLPDIPARLVTELSPYEYAVIEFIENISRRELEWRDEVEAIGKLHILNAQGNAVWGIAGTAKQLGLPEHRISVALRVFRDLASPRISDATSMRQAYNMLIRLDERAEADVQSDLIGTMQTMFDGPKGPTGPDGSPANTFAAAGVHSLNPPGGTSVAGDPQGHSTGTGPIPPIAPPAPESLLNSSFLEWAPDYTGMPFNLIHCDFPYGVNLFSGAWSGRGAWKSELAQQGAYSDTREVYLDLIKCLCENRDRIMSQSAHLMFWCSSNIRIQFETIEMFRELAPDLIFQEIPLYWHKTDNVGIVPDPKREARRVVETCLVASRDDRLIIKPISNAYGAPTNKDHHPSTKPEPMLRHFMQMFVDENTRMLDPTCGSATSLRAAESLGATQVMGLEIDPEYFKSAQSALRNFRLLRKVSK